MKVKKYGNFLSEQMGSNILGGNSLFGKNIYDEDNEYHGEKNLFYVFNRKEEWYIEFSRVLSSTDYTHTKGFSASLHEDITHHGHNWRSVFYTDYPETFDKYVITKEQFISFLNYTIS